MMIDTFWEKIGEGIAGEFNARIFTPALVFWGSGFVFFGFSVGWETLFKGFMGLDTATGVVVLVSILFLLYFSTRLLNWVTLPALKFFEGYWQKPFDGFRDTLSDRVTKKLVKKKLRLDATIEKLKKDGSDRRLQREFKRLESELSCYPENADLIMPTELGNTLRAAEEYSERVYGLEITTVWPRFWLILPESVQKEMINLRQTLDSSIIAVVWSILYSVWVMFSWWAVAIAVVSAVLAYRRALRAAEVYGVVLRSCFDLYRTELYRQLHWPAPDSPGNEKECGEKLSTYIGRGIVDRTTQFTSLRKSGNVDK